MQAGHKCNSHLSYMVEKRNCSDYFIIDGDNDDNNVHDLEQRGEAKRGGSSYAV